MNDRTSIPNPVIADVFHRAGLIEKWGRGTNRVIAMCKKHGAPPPRFEERQGFMIVTFRAQMVAESTAEVSRAQSGAQVGPKSGPSRDQVGTKWKSCGFAVKNSPWLQ